MYTNVAVPVFEERVTHLVPILERDLFFFLLDDMLKAGAAIDDGERGWRRKGRCWDSGGTGRVSPRDDGARIPMA